MTILCTGAAVVDVLVSVPETMPEPGSSALVETIALAAGGCGVNTAIALARLGVPVQFMAVLGADGAGDFLRAQLRGAGVGLEYFWQSRLVATKSAVVLLDSSGERAFLRTRGGGNAIAPVDFSYLDWSRFSHLHIGGNYSLRRLLGVDLAAVLRLARKSGVVTSLDTVWSSDGNWEVLLPALGAIDYLLPSLVEAQAISGERVPEKIARWFVGHGSRTVVLKLGAEGAYCYAPQIEVYLPAAPVPGGRVIDTTGAGDAFCAGFLGALVEGHSLIEAVRWANAWGAVAVSGLGATGGLVDRQQLETVLKAQD
ncbi:carbohydrate kinase family protein [Gloeobacter kilaueensis]|uniref:Ribokinase n=1 Tax=Gloeobacter kilaueensis (strain ATCC BAA-2537 / CCAP 1431/1 / ULC 316 / JS1) TaxID=1183438 RepID=U5QES4_GLOK1|nr:carbohydrate kinase family protein [Gloeobacter kilaueensis]AGY57411.1 ribokinase [Gloeobacter kilaueensis JS1]